MADGLTVRSRTPGPGMIQCDLSIQPVLQVPLHQLSPHQPLQLHLGDEALGLTGGVRAGYSVASARDLFSDVVSQALSGE